MNFPLVTIVTPTYNQAEYLSETIDSVLAQDYPNIEYIVIDDGSSDETGLVLERYAGKVTIIRQENRGQANTLNRGWKLAKGDLIGYLSSDDQLEVNAITNLVTPFEENESCVVTYCDFVLIDSFGKLIKEVKSENFDKNRLCVDLVCQPGPGALFRKEVFDKTGGWNGNLRQTPDFDFWLRVADFGDFVRVSKSLARYRIHEKSASFAVITVERSTEIVKVMENYWSQKPANNIISLSLSNAYQIAAKNHAKSGRYKNALACAWFSIKLNWKTVFSPNFWRRIFVGMARRSFYNAIEKLK